LTHNSCRVDQPTRIRIEYTDVCVFDADARWLVNAAAIVSQGKHTPFLGYELPGQVRHTIVSGRLAYSR